jgi:hypothetical protein
MHVIYINYYSDSNLERRQEYLACLKNNQDLEFVDKIFVFLDQSSDRNDILDCQKLEFIELGRRLEFHDVIGHANKHLPNGTIVTILNLDIYLENSHTWKNIDQDFFQCGTAPKAMVIKRHNITADGTPVKENKYWTLGSFCDGWTFKLPFDSNFVKEDFNFCVGNAPGCDNVMMYLMNIYYHTFSWGDKYRAFHLDICRKVDGRTRIISTDSTDYRAKERTNQHLNIPADQDWVTLLKTDTRPSVTMNKQSYVHPTHLLTKGK